MSEGHTFEDIAVGDTAEFGDYRVTAEGIAAFRGEYDDLAPATEAGPMGGGTVASAGHVAAMCIRLTHETDSYPGSALGGVGLDAVRWLAPVRAGDRLRLRAEVVDKRPSRSRDDRGYTRTRWEAINQHDEVVVSLVIEEVWARRDDAA